MVSLTRCRSGVDDHRLSRTTPMSARAAPLLALLVMAGCGTTLSQQVLAPPPGPVGAARAGERLRRGLTAVAMMEGGFSGGAVSSRGGGGFWQFKRGGARGSGLEVSFWVAERRALGRSTTAAARYLGDLY